ncbi:MAG: hypothetical protein K0S21_499, partial [Rhizobiaceae bacterium]|nr:hypothetical protein [Rhizobiaceae bacterium]
MQKIEGSLVLSASDLVGHLNCRHLTSLDIDVAEGRLAKPYVSDPLLDILRERGARHEQGYVDHLKSEGLEITVIEGRFVDQEAVSRTCQAMEAGAEIIVQGAFRSGNWVGRTDVLRRTSTPSGLGAWSYEVTDTKLARETKGGTVLQLCLYADLVAAVQGVQPEQCYVVAPWTGYDAQRYRMEDYGAYFRYVRGALAAAVASGKPGEAYPEPCEHCDVCRWQRRCEERRRADDHLSLVAGATKVQIQELRSRGIDTVASLGAMPLPLAWKPSRGAASSFQRIREQARIQTASWEAGRLLHELLPVEAGFGLACLPEPSPGDVFFDLEGDPFTGEGGLEYLFGYAHSRDGGAIAHTSDWAFTRAGEKAAFERFVDFVTDRLKAHPDLHVYHYAPYEPAALKRLMGRYASRQEEVDFLLRSERFVDLYGVVRNGLRAGVESYSIKRLEPLYGFCRDIPLRDANRALARLQAGLELGDPGSIEASDRASVAGYNRDDCVSTLRLRDWLEGCRAGLIRQGVDVPRPASPDGQPGEKLGERQERVNALIERLTADVPADAAERSPRQHASWLLAHSLDWHRREDRAVWWEFYRLRDLAAEDLLDEREALSGLAFLGQSGGTAKAPVHRYSFPPQETEFRGGEDLHMVGGDRFGSIKEISIEDRWVDIKKRGDRIADHPEAVFAHKAIGTGVLADALLRIGAHVAEHGIEGEGPYRAARDLLMRRPPLAAGRQFRMPGEPALDAARRTALELQGGIFPIQGPPGAGKTYTGA